MKEIKNILVPIDLSDILSPCVTYGLELARRFGARLHLLYAVHEPGEASGFSTPHVAMDRVHEEAKRRADRQLRLYAASNLGDFSDFVTAVRIGSPHSVINQYADKEGIDLIVMGVKRRGRLAQALSQKTTNRVLESSAKPVLRLVISS
ncbi:MAG: universal stress protein [Deltaproteobacteria bacterium]|nr:universal stress protein [Deltaproteobacteria bacterium]MBW2123855.1 universal stress protein [Deltaproteobacteria bacterium]